MGKHIPEEYRVDESKLFREGKLTLSQARKKYPEWYEKVVVGKDRTPDKWDIKSKVHGENPYALYDWWLNKIRTGATFHHRYFNIMCLAIYGAKCDVPYEKVKKDAYSLIEFLNDIHPEEPFTKSDCDCALECYDDKYATFPIRDIEKISGIPIERNKRNGQRQADHLEEARAIRDIRMKRQGRKWTDRNGRPDKRKLVREYVYLHPEESVTEISKALGVSRTTVYKYMPKKEVFNSSKEGGMMQHDFKNDYVVVDENGEPVYVIESDLSDYDKMRLERLKAYQERMKEKENGKDN